MMFYKKSILLLNAIEVMFTKMILKLYVNADIYIVTSKETRRDTKIFVAFISGR